MNPNTQSRLRNAALDALTEGDDTSALELLQMICPDSPAMVGQFALPAAANATSIREGPAHDYHFWAAFLRNRFIPFLLENGRIRFTSNELLSWLERMTDLPLTTGDVATYSDGKTITWRARVSSALTSLKEQGQVVSYRKGRVYSVRALPPSC